MVPTENTVSMLVSSDNKFIWKIGSLSSRTPCIRELHFGHSTPVTYVNFQFVHNRYSVSQDTNDPLAVYQAAGVYSQTMQQLPDRSATDTGDVW